ncbi:MAG: hypothetical protein DCC67_08095 [Planctomycetota bacterium]|nr:MAG: hypothetical protein DCC67_08095 [Planctomycetota bacterium]
MNEFFRNTLGFWGWLAVGLVPPAIFALYFLKLKRTRGINRDRRKLAAQRERLAGVLYGQ